MSRSRLLATIAIGSFLAASPMCQAQEPKLLQTLKGHEASLTCVAFHPNGKILASSSDDHRIKLWDLNTGKVISTFQGHEKQVKCVAFNPTGRFLASASWDCTIKLWEVASGKCIETYQRGAWELWSVAFSADGKYVASGGNGGTVLLWDIATGKETAKFPSDGRVSANPHAIAFSPDGKTLAAGGGRVREANLSSVKLWDIATGKETATAASHNRFADSIAFSPDGKTLASAGGIAGGAGGIGVFELYLWDVATGKKLFGAERVGGVFVAFSPDGKILATGTGPLTAKAQPVNFSLIDLNPQPPKKIPPGIMLWDVAARKPVITFHGHDAWATCGAFSPDGKLLATGSQDKTIKLRELPPAKGK